MYNKIPSSPLGGYTIVSTRISSLQHLHLQASVHALENNSLIFGNMLTVRSVHSFLNSSNVPLVGLGYELDRPGHFDAISFAVE